MIDAAILGAALLWLRNHYDVGDPKLKERVIETIDKVLDQWGVKGSDQGRFESLFLEDKLRPGLQSR